MQYACQQSVCRNKFFADIDEPISFICGSCGELGSPRKRTIFSYDKTNTIFETLEISDQRSSQNGLVPEALVFHGKKGAFSVPFCENCMGFLRLRKVPKFCAASGFRLHTIPECLAVLNTVESRLIGPGVCFTTCYNLVGDGQECSKGNAINFWNDAYRVVTSLPRPIANSGVVRIKCRGDSDPSRLFEVRPNLLRRALLWLLDNNPLYRKVTISDQVLRDLELGGEAQEIPTITVQEKEGTSVRQSDSDGDVHASDGIDDVYESNEFYHLRTGDCSTETESDKIMQSLCVEVDGLTSSINEYTTKTMMQACFPVLFPDGRGGIFPLSDEERMYSYDLAAYCAHLMAWHDRRFVIHRNFKFFCLNLIQRRQVDGLTRKLRTTPQRTDESNALDANGRARQLLKELKPYFKVVRGSGLYWSDVRDQLMSLIGNDALRSPFPTFFFTLSAADTVWPDFFRACNLALSQEEASTLSASQRRQYLNENADIASKHFYRRFKSFFENIICGDSKPLGEICDFFWRVEFQKRGSPHVHGLLWVKDAPNVLELSKTEQGRDELAAFVDRYVTADIPKAYQGNDCACEVCVRHENNPDLDPLTQRPPDPSDACSQCDLARVVRRVQQHVCYPHSRCRTKRGSCRFEFPKQTRDETAITVDRSENGALRMQVECHRSDPGTNNYNAELLSAWRANMDIKLVGNAYGAAEYTAAYVSKAEPDTTRFLDAITRALNQCPDSSEYCDVLRKVGKATLAAREVSAQEALWILQNGLPMYGKSRNVVKVKASRHSHRFYRVDVSTCRDEIENNRPPTEEQIRVDVLEAAYMARPESFEDMLYKEFLQNYEISKSPPASGQSLERWSRTDGKGYIKARRNAQALAKVPRWRADPDIADYWFSEILFRKPCAPWMIFPRLMPSALRSLRI